MSLKIMPEKVILIFIMALLTNRLHFINQQITSRAHHSNRFTARSISLLPQGPGVFSTMKPAACNACLTTTLLQ